MRSHAPIYALTRKAEMSLSSYLKRHRATRKISITAFHDPEDEKGEVEDEIVFNINALSKTSSTHVTVLSSFAIYVKGDTMYLTRARKDSKGDVQGEQLVQTSTNNGFDAFIKDAIAKVLNDVQVLSETL